MPIQLRTLGGLSLQSSERSAPGRSTQRKRLALLALLATTRNGGLSRDKVMAYLWPEREEEQSRHALSQALYALRRELGEASIISGIDELRLNHELVSSDVAQFNAAVAARDLQKIVAVYAGPFLDGFHLPDAPEFEEWAAQRRTEYERGYTAALDELAAQSLSAGEAKKAAEWLQARAAVDRLNSEVALRLMRALAAAGDRAGALRHFRMHAALLREEMQLEPPAELAVFAAECAQISERTPPSVSPVHQPSAVVELPPPPPPQIRRRFRRTWLGGAVTTAVAFAIVVVAIRGNPRTPQSDILLAAVSGPDTSLSLAVREALRAELEQSDRVRVLSDMVAARTLELMRLPPSTWLDEPRALEVAQRRGIPIVISASVQPVGTGVQIVARMFDVATERAIASVIERPNRDEDILQAVADIAVTMRERVAHSAPNRTSPLPAVTTTSLPALRNYALARHSLAIWDRTRALEFLEAALVLDSTFALAHYLAGDLLWYIDKQRHSDEHMMRALALADRLPPREHLIVKARYQQLVRDEPDSALVYWKLLMDSYPDEPLGYEGMRWAYRALAHTTQMAAASERAYRYDPTQRRTYFYDRMMERLQAGDSVGAMTAAPQVNETAPGQVLLYWHVFNGRKPPLSGLNSVDRHYALLMHHRLDDAALSLDTLRSASLQFYPRALLAQARMEAEFGREVQARERLAEVVGWIEQADLSPPAYARLCERAAELAAHLKDYSVLQRLHAIINRHDRGRSLRSYQLARATLSAAEAFARGNYRRAIAETEKTSTDMFYARSVATVLLLRADALARAGDLNAARRIYQRLAQSLTLKDGDIEARALIADIARIRLGSRSRGD